MFRFVTLRFASLRFVSFRFVTLRFATFRFVSLRLFHLPIYFPAFFSWRQVGRNERINYAKGLLQREFLPHVGIGAGTEAKKVRRATRARR